MPSIGRWNATWLGLGIAPTPALLRQFHDLVARYAEPHRHYHTRHHLEECFEHLDKLRAFAERPAEVELALWYHDAIHDPRSSENEARSAELAAAILRQAGAPADCTQRVHDLILATRHSAAPHSADARVLLDVDLAILAAPPERFDEYERQVRAEYAHVPNFIFRRERAKLLRAFLSRPAIFHTPIFAARYEQPARANLARSLARLAPKALAKHQ